jgi:periplasmic copper chaperone A
MRMGSAFFCADFPLESGIENFVACILNSDYGLMTSWDEASVVSDFPAQPRLWGARVAGTAGPGRPASYSVIVNRGRDDRDNGKASECGSILSKRSLAVFRLPRPAFAALACLMFSTAQVSGAGEALIVSDAWVAATDQTGGDAPLLAAIRNETNSPDALMRVRCPVANFFEKHTVDRGEGAPAMRAVSSIPIPPASTVVLKPTEYHVMLLQIRQPLAVGGRFNCTLVFQKAGSIETEVEVRRNP